jgi:hypothetical protein
MDAVLPPTNSSVIGDIFHIPDEAMPKDLKSC